MSEEIYAECNDAAKSNERDIPTAELAALRTENKILHLVYSGRRQRICELQSLNAEMLAELKTIYDVRYEPDKVLCIIENWHAKAEARNG